jgi:hypothetical protein
MKKSFGLLIVVALILMGGSAYALPSYLSSFNSTYNTSNTVLNTCGLCHIDPNGGGARNAYGTDYANNGHNFAAIESLDSDKDGFTNIVEINARTFPGDASSHPAAAACTSYTYTLGACQPNGTAPVISYVGTPSGCSGGATPATTQPCTYTPPTCTSFNYSAWGTCQSNGTQSRTVISASPSGCTGGSPVLTQSCTYTPPTPSSCTYTYSSWGACQSDGTQSRTVISSSPAGCTGTPVLSQFCTYTPPTPSSCTYTYSSWGACQSDGTQSRTVISSSPAGCTGTPVLSQSCTYTPPPSAQNLLPLPTGQQVFAYSPVDSPALSSDPSQAEPIGIGPAANGGDTVSLQVQAQFSDPVNVSLAIYAPSIDDLDLYFMDSSNNLQFVSKGIIESESASSTMSYAGSHDSDDDGSESGNPGSGSSGSVGINQAAFENFVLWKTNVTSLDSNLLTMNTSDLPTGVYTLVLTAKPSNSGDSRGEGTGNQNYYRWTTYLIVK